jgi:hypothetical protein
MPAGTAAWQPVVEIEANRLPRAERHGAIVSQVARRGGHHIIAVFVRI